MIKRYILNLSISAVVIVFLILTVVPVNAEESKGQDAKALFEAKCSLCHEIERPRSMKKTEKDWRETVMRMKNTNACPINDEEANIIIKYLSANYGI